MNWLEQAWSDAGNWITRATELAPERDPTKWDWNFNKEVDWNVGHSAIWRESIMPWAEASFFTTVSLHLPGTFAGTGSYLSSMRAQWFDEKWRAATGTGESQLISYDPRQSSTYVEIAKPTSEGLANIALGAVTWSAGGAGGWAAFAGEKWLDRQLGIPDPKGDYGKLAPLVGAIVGSLVSAYKNLTDDGTTDPAAKSDSEKLLAQLTALLTSTGSRDASPRSTGTPTANVSAPRGMDQKDALMLAGVGVLGFMALNKK